MLRDYLMDESAEFSSMENNPLIYTLISPRLITCADKKEIKADVVLKAAVDTVERYIKTLTPATIKQLKKEFKSAAVLDMFKLSKNYKTTFDEYYRDFRDIITNNTTSFLKCVELTKKFDEMYNSPEMLTFRNTL